MSACRGEAELQGTVFIVTQGAENYKLGLVKVTAIPESEISQFVANKKKEVVDASSALQGELSPVKAEIERNQAVFNEAKKNYDDVNSQKDIIKSKVDLLQREFNPYLLNPSPYLAEFETPEDVSERNKQRSIGKQLDGAKKQLASYEMKLEQLNKIKTASENQLKASEARLGEILTKIRAYLNPTYLFEGIPLGNFKTVTDADGKFSLTLPKGKFAFYATSQRRVYTETEEYHWLVWVHLDGPETKNFILSNQNMLGQDSEDSVFKFKELVPILDSPQSEPKKGTLST